jgi:hypothetical protein
MARKDMEKADLQKPDIHNMNRQLQGALSQLNAENWQRVWNNEEFREQMKRTQEDARNAMEEAMKTQQEYWKQHQDEYFEQMKKASEEVKKSFEELKKSGVLNEDFEFYFEQHPPLIPPVPPIDFDFVVPPENIFPPVPHIEDMPEIQESPDIQVIPEIEIEEDIDAPAGPAENNKNSLDKLNN